MRKNASIARRGSGVLLFLLSVQLAGGAEARSASTADALTVYSLPPLVVTTSKWEETPLTLPSFVLAPPRLIDGSTPFSFPASLTGARIIARVNIKWVVAPDGSVIRVKPESAILVDADTGTELSQAFVGELVRWKMLPKEALSMPLNEVRGAIAVEFGKAAAAVISKWKYRPGRMLNGEPATIELSDRVVFIPANPNRDAQLRILKR